MSHTFARELGEIDRLGSKLHLAGLDLREIQHVVNEVEQVLRTGEDVAEILLVLGRHRSDLAPVHQLREPDDRIERRPQFV